MKVMGFNPSTEAGLQPELIILPFRLPFHGDVQKPTHQKDAFKEDLRVPIPVLIVCFSC